LERERRRAEREGVPPPAAPPPVEEPPGELVAAVDAGFAEAPMGEPPVAEPPSAGEHVAHDPAVPIEGPAEKPVVAEPPAGEQAVGHDALVAEEPDALGTEDAVALGAEGAVAHGPSGAEDPVAHDVSVDPPVAREPHAAEPPLDEEPAAHHAAPLERPVAGEPVAEDPVVAEPPVAEGPAAYEPAAPEPESADPLPVEAVPVEATPVAEHPEHDEAEHDLPEPDAAEPVAASSPRPRRRPDGYEIPGLPPADPPAEPEPLPEPPPPVRERSRRAAPAAIAGGAGGVPGAPGGIERRRPRRGGLSRLLALVALLAVAAVVVLLVHSLKGSSPRTRTPAQTVVKVLIPEGKTRLQIAQIAKADGLVGSYRAAAKRSDLLNPAHYGAPSDTPTLEGFLFPATYDMDKGAPVSRLVEEQVSAFQENFGAEDVSRAKALGVTPYGLLTVASMVEREAQVPGDRAKIAAVIYNRLKAGMPLGIDAAIYYAVELQRNIPTYTHELTESQLQMDSPYNTRTHTGLPPTPISNPGTASIQAAAHPAHAGYLYYVAGADGCGEQVFSDTQAAFEKNVAAYEEAKRKNGGHPPACKKK
jgi:UPF0755 protein